MKKRLMTLAMAFTMLAATTVFAEYSFIDLEEERFDWCAPQIEEMYEAGYINGYEDATYRPDNEVTKLECISLFARVMGSKDVANAEVLELAHEQYDSALKGSSLVWGEDELAYLMYKGAFTASDLTTYINGDLKDKPMTRGEAAVIITKAMGGEKAATSESAIELHYKDARDIPTNLLQYVKFVTDEGIMNGIDDAFCYDQSVTRAQIAVMLKRVSDKCGYEFFEGRIDEIDKDEETITYNIDDEPVTVSYADAVDFYIRGEKTTVDSVPANVKAVFQFSNDELIAVDAMSNQPDEVITAIFTGYNLSTNTLTVKVKATETSTNVKSYMGDANVPVTYGGSPATIKAFSNGDLIELSMSDGRIQSIKGVEKTTNISQAKVKDISLVDGVSYITISSADEALDGKSFPVSNKVKITKNNNECALTSLYSGDQVSLTVSMGEVVKITATSVSSTIEGVILGINISEKSEIVLNVAGEKRTYQVPVECEMDIKGEAGDIYDLRIGDNITLTVQSNAVIKIKSVASNVNTSGKVIGTVTAVNKSYKLIAVQTEDGTNAVNVHINNSTSYSVISGTSNKESLDKIDVGDTVECFVTPSNGVYVANLVVISKAAK